MVTSQKSTTDQVFFEKGIVVVMTLNNRVDFIFLVACTGLTKMSKPPDNDFEVFPTCRYRCQACAREKTSDDLSLPFFKDALVNSDLVTRGNGFLIGVPGRFEQAERLHIQRVARKRAGLFGPNFDEAQGLH